MIQLQYRIPKGMKPTAAEVARWREEFIAGRRVPGIRIRAIDWRYGGTQAEIRLRLRKPKRARVAGIVDHYAGASVTMCDYDRPKDVSMRRAWAVARMLKLKFRAVEISRTRRGWHYVIYWNREFTPAEIVAIQAILGSDAFRETYNLARVFSGLDQRDASKRWNFMFKEKIR